MDTIEALEIVEELARQNIIDGDFCGDKELLTQQKRQEEACDIVRDLFVDMLVPEG